METDNSEIRKNQPEKKVDYKPRDLSIIEICLSGGTEKLKEKQYVWKTLLSDLDQGILSEDEVLTPLVLIDGGILATKVNKRRLARKMLIGGSMSIFQRGDSDLNIGYEPYIELGTLDNKGKTSGRWRVGINDMNERQASFEELKLNPSFAKYFVLEKNPKGSGQILKFIFKKNS
jgi:hypothetical protein